VGRVVAGDIAAGTAVVGIVEVDIVEADNMAVEDNNRVAVDNNTHLPADPHGPQNK
jgi:hypothetical protein